MKPLQLTKTHCGSETKQARNSSRRLRRFEICSNRFDSRIHGKIGSRITSRISSRISRISRFQSRISRILIVIVIVQSTCTDIITYRKAKFRICKFVFKYVFELVFELMSSSLGRCCSQTLCCCCSC